MVQRLYGGQDVLLSAGPGAGKDERCVEHLPGVEEDSVVVADVVVLAVVVVRCDVAAADWAVRERLATLQRASLYRIVSFYERKCIRENVTAQYDSCLLYTSPSPRDS